MNFKDFGLAVFLLGLLIAGWAGYKWDALGKQSTGESLRALSTIGTGRTLERIEATARGVKLEEQRDKMYPWMIGGGAAALLGLGIMFAARGSSGPTRVCPKCAETVKARAVLCKHCGSELAPIDDDPDYHADEESSDDRAYSYRALAKAAEQAERKSDTRR